MKRIAVNNLLPATNYAIRVRAVGVDGVSEWTTKYPFDTISDSIAPKVPTGITWEPTGTSFHGEWNSVNQNINNDTISIYRYEIELKENTNGTIKYTSVIQDTSVGKVTFDFSLEQNSALFVGGPHKSLTMRVRAVDNKELKSAWSAPLTAVNNPPDPPTNAVVKEAADSISLSWTAPVNNKNVVGYVVYVGSTSNFTATKLNEVYFGTSTSFTYTSTTYSKQYFKIRSRNAFNQESTDLLANGTPVSPFIVDTTPPNIPSISSSSITANPNGVGARANISWTLSPVPADLAGYKLRYKKSGVSESWSESAYSKDVTSATVPLEYSYTNYEFQVRATDFSANYSNWSASTTVTAPANTPPANVTGLTAKPGRDSITYSWTPVNDTDLKNYEVTFSTSSTFASGNLTFLTGTSPSLSIGGLNPSTTYYARVRASDHGGLNSASWSATNTSATTSFPVTPLSDGVAPSSSPAANVYGGIGYLYVSWSPVTNADIVTYDVHISTTNNFAPGAGTKVVETSSTNVIIEKTTTGADLVYGTTYYIKIVARDRDGSAAAGTQGSAAPLKAVIGDLTLIPSDIGAPTVVQAQGYASTAESNAITSAASDAQAKANAAKGEAISSANGYTDTRESVINSKISNDITNFNTNTVQPGLNGKNKITYSTSLPGSTANLAGDLWYVRNGTGQITGIYEGGGGTTWTLRPLNDAAIGNLSVGKLVTGTMSATTFTLGSGGVISSANYSPTNKTGFALNDTGLVIYNGVIKAAALDVTLGGGSNMVANSNFVNDLYSWANAGSTTTFHDSTGLQTIYRRYAKIIGDSTSTTSDRYIWQDVGNLQPNEPYVLTAWVFRTDSTVVSSYLDRILGVSSTTKYYGPNVTDMSGNTLTMSNFPTSKWTRVQLKFTPTVNEPTRIRLYSSISGTVGLYYGMVQLEQGEVASSYSPRTDEILPGTVQGDMVKAGTIDGNVLKSNTSFTNNLFVASTIQVGNASTTGYIQSYGYTPGSQGFSLSKTGLVIEGTGNSINAAAINAGKVAAQYVTIGSTTTFDSNYDPTTKETPTGAQAKATTAQTNAINTAAGDATTKANNAQTTAISTAATDATNKANSAELAAKRAAVNVMTSASGIVNDGADSSSVFSRSGSASIVAVDEPTARDGKVLRKVGVGNGWWVDKKTIPFDPEKLYRVTARVRVTTNATTGGGLLYAGIEGVGADGISFVNNNGDNSSSSQHYVAASGVSLNSSQGWVTFTSYVKGTAASGTGGNSNYDQAAKLHQNVKFIRPLVILDYNNGNGVWELDYMQIEAFEAGGVEKAIIGGANQGVIAATDALFQNRNASLGAWTGDYPDGANSWSSSVAPIKETSITRTVNAARFNTTTADTGMAIANMVNGYFNYTQYVVVEVDAYLVSGNFSGSGILFDWNGMTPSPRNSLSFNQMQPSPATGRWYRFSKVFKAPSSGTFTNWSAWAMANWEHDGMGPKTSKEIIFDKIGFRAATTAEIQAYDAPGNLAAKATELEGYADNAADDAKNAAISAAALDADSKASAAQTNATNAAIANALTTYGPSRDLVLSWKHPNTTNISGGYIETNTITAKQLLLTDLGNYAFGSDFENTNEMPWTLSPSHSVVSDQKNSGTKSLKVITGTSTLKRIIPVEQGNVIYIEYWVRRTADWNGTPGNSKVRLGVSPGGAFVGDVNFSASSVGPADTWVKRSGQFTVGAGISNIAVTITSDGTAGNVWLDDIVVLNQNSSKLIVDGMISANKMSAGTYTGGEFIIGSGGILKTNNSEVTITSSGIAVTGANSSITASALTTGTFASGQALTVNGNMTLNGNMVVQPGGYIKSSEYTGTTYAAASGAGWYLGRDGLRISSGAVAASALTAGTLGSSTGRIDIGAGASLVLNGGHLRSNTYTYSGQSGTTYAYNANATAGWYLGNDGLVIAQGAVSASAITAGTISGTNTITLSGANAKIVGTGFTLSGSGLTITSGYVAASTINVTSQFSNDVGANITSIDGGIIKTGSIQSTTFGTYGASTTQPVWSISMDGSATFSRMRILGNTVLGNSNLDSNSQIASHNFIQGSTGWRIQANGNAEFSDVNIRGNSTFSGTLTGNVGTFTGTLNGGAITGGTLDISSSTNNVRVQINSSGLTVKNFAGANLLTTLNGNIAMYGSVFFNSGKTYFNSSGIDLASAQINNLSMIQNFYEDYIIFNTPNSYGRVSGGSNVKFRIGTNTGTTNGGSAITFHNNWAAATHETMNAATPNDTNTVDFYCRALTRTTNNAYSDLKLKKNVIDVDKVYAEYIIKKLNIKNFEFLSDPNVKRTGIIAQEVREFIPEIVSSTGDGTLVVNYEELYTLNISATQKLIEDKEVLESKVESLETENLDLIARIERLEEFMNQANSSGSGA